MRTINLGSSLIYFEVRIYQQIWIAVIDRVPFLLILDSDVNIRIAGMSVYSGSSYLVIFIYFLCTPCFVCGGCRSVVYQFISKSIITVFNYINGVVFFGLNSIIFFLCAFPNFCVNSLIVNMSLDNFWVDTVSSFIFP